MIINGGKFWDEWWLDGWGAIRIVDEFKRSGFYWTGYFHRGVLSTPVEVRPYIYKWVVFLSYGLAAISAIRLYTKTWPASRTAGLWFGIVFTLLPINFARISAINAKAALCYLFFFLAWDLTVSSTELKPRFRSKLARVGSLLLFYLSYETNSFLVFYALPVLHLFSLRADANSGTSVRHLFRWVLSKSDYFVLPLVYWVTKATWLPHGPGYETYNEIRFSSSLASSFLKSISSAGKTSFAMLSGKHLVDLVATFLGAALILSLVRPLAKSDPKVSNEKISDGRPRFAMIVGALALLLATFPYAIVGKPAGIFDWTQRNGILYPLPFALLVSALAGWIGSLRSRVSIFPRTGGLIVAAAFFLCVNVQVSVDFLRDWQIQEAIIRHLKRSPAAKTASAFIFDYAPIQKNLGLQRTLRMYECGGLVNTAFGGENRFAYTKEEVSNLESVYEYLGRSEVNVNGPGYHMEKFKRLRPTDSWCEMEIVPGNALVERRAIPVLVGVLFRHISDERYTAYLDDLVIFRERCAPVLAESTVR